MAASIGLVGKVVAINLALFVLKTSNEGLLTLNITSTILILCGFTFTLYSRLHLLMQPGQTKVRFLRGLLITIIITAIAWNIPPVVGTILTLHGYPVLGSKIYQHSLYIDFGYSAQDILMSLMYIHFCRTYVAEVPAYATESEARRIRSIFWQLVVASLVVIISDAATLVLVVKKMLLARYTFTSLLFALKLKVEFLVLTRLVDVSTVKQQIMARGNINVWGQDLEQNADTDIDLARGR
jgi:hypothetical protein